MKKNSPADNARSTLAKMDFPHFFELITKMTDSRKQQELVEEAIAIAKSHHKIDVLRQLSSLNLKCSTSIYPKLIFALVDIQAYDAAIGLVVLNDYDLVEANGWYFLAHSLLKNKQFKKVRKVYKYLKLLYQQKEIVAESLVDIPLPKYIFDWLFWLDQYIKLKLIGDDNFISRGIRALISIDLETFKIACSKLQQVKDSSLKSKLITELYLHLVLEDNPEKYEILFTCLPEDLTWLANVPKLIKGDEKQIAVLDKVPCTHPNTFATRILNKVVKLTLSNVTKYDDEHLTEYIINTAALTEKYRGVFISEACKILLKLKRLDAFIILTPYLSSFLREGAINLLLDHELTEKQYQIIATYLEKLESTSPYMTLTQILEKIPNEFIIAERERRTAVLATKIRQDYAKLSKINRRHRQYDELTANLKELLKLQDRENAHILCKKLTPSKNRDHYVMQLLRLTLTANDYEMAKRVIGLFNEVKILSTLQSFLAHYQKSNYRNAFKQLVKLKENEKFIELLAECVEHILQEENVALSIRFLINNHVFGLGNYTYWDLSADKFGNASNNNEAHNIKTRVTLDILSHYQKRAKMRKFLATLKQRETKNYGPYLLAGLLKNNRLFCAIELLNNSIEIKGTYEVKKMPKCLTELIEEYLGGKDPQVSDIQALMGLEIESFRHSFVRTLLADIFIFFGEKKFKLILAITDKKLQHYYLELAIINCIRMGQFSLATQACINLPEDMQESWKQIIKLAEEKNYIALIDLLIAKSAEADQLLTWAINTWLDGKKTTTLLKRAKHYLTQWTKLLQQHNNSNTKFEVEETRQFWRREKSYDELIYILLNNWQKTLCLQNAYGLFINGLIDLFEISVKTTIPDTIKFNLQTRLRHVIKTLLTYSTNHRETYNLLLKASELLATFEDSFPSYLINTVLDTLLKRNELNYACELLTFIDNNKLANSYWQEGARLKVCAKLIEINHTNKAYKLLLKYKMDGLTYMTSRAVNKWVINLINNGELKQALKFINTFLTDNNQEEYQSILEAMLTKEYIVPTRELVNKNITSPKIKISLLKQLQQKYLTMLGNYIDQKRSDALFLSYHKLQIFLQLVNANNQKQANLCKNNLIVELRGQLDKAFLAFYKQHYGNPPQRNGRPLGVYFPVVPDLQNKTVRERLEEYFSTMLRISDFSTRFPNQFTFLLTIQPLHNNSYLWLRQLYKLANEHKHDHDLLHTPNVDGLGIDMTVFLPKIIDGVTELLLKLFHPQLDTSQLKFSDYVKFDTTTTSTQLSQSNIPLLSNIASPSTSPPRQQQTPHTFT